MTHSGVRRTGAPRARDVCALLIGLACLGSVLPVESQETAAPEIYPEYHVKAAFLYNFCKFVDWPPGMSDATSPITVCVFGKDPFEGALEETLRGRTAGGRDLVTRHVESESPLSACHVLFVPSTDEAHLSSVLESVARLPVLTVGETEHFGRLGGIVRFTLEDDRVQFVVNASSAKRAGLKISAKLLSIARAVVRPDGQAP